MAQAARRWDILIPVRPKAVQSTRFQGNHCYVDPAVAKWKRSVIPYIDEVCRKVGPPTELPVRIVLLKHMFKYPKSRKKMAGFLEAGGEIPMLLSGDVADNLNKGILDCCIGRVYTDDKQIWTVDRLSKVYCRQDAIHVIFEETPDVLDLDGNRADGNDTLSCLF